jgi:hypothetical protein
MRNFFLASLFLGSEPWPRFGMQRLSFVDYTLKVSHLFYSIPAKPRQGGLISKVDFSVFAHKI